MGIIIKDEARWKELTHKIFKGQIILDRLKEMVKEGQKNIRELRDERKSLKIKRNSSKA